MGTGLSQWQCITLALAETADLSALTQEAREKVERLRAAYSADQPLTTIFAHASDLERRIAHIEYIIGGVISAAEQLALADRKWVNNELQRVRAEVRRKRIARMTRRPRRNRSNKHVSGIPW